MTTQIQPCPFCNKDTCLYCMEEDPEFFVICSYCRAQGPKSISVNRAIGIWNIVSEHVKEVQDAHTLGKNDQSRPA